MMPNVTTTTSTAIPAHLAHLFGDKRADAPKKARLVFALDATMSRQATWDSASNLTGRMFEAITGNQLEIQLCYFQGFNKFKATPWVSSARALSDLMRGVSCLSGETQLERVIRHIEKENARTKVSACCYIGDAIEEPPEQLYGAARRLDHVPLFMFQEGDDPRVARVFQQLARMTGGAHSSFNSTSAQRLSDLLRAVCAYTTGGRDALQALTSESAKLLLTQVKK
jgi:hypothetical protein